MENFIFCAVNSVERLYDLLKAELYSKPCLNIKMIRGWAANC